MLLFIDLLKVLCSNNVNSFPNQLLFIQETFVEGRVGTSARKGEAYAPIQGSTWTSRPGRDSALTKTSIKVRALQRGSLHPIERESGPHVLASGSLLPQSPCMTPREGGGGTFTHRVCSLLSASCLHSQNYPRIRMLLWEDSNPGAMREHAGPDAAPSDPGRCPPSVGVSKRHLR